MGMFPFMRGSVASTMAIAMVAALVAFNADVPMCEAGIILPPQIKFDAKDLDQALNGRSSSAPSSTAPRQAPSWPSQENEQPTPLGLLKSPLPASNSSSSSSSTSAGGAAGPTVALCMFASATIAPDDATIGRLADEQSLLLPDPPGTQLFHPPRNVRS